MIQPPKRPPGRPAVLTPEQRTRPYSVRLTEARIEKLKQLGSEWLNKAIDRAERARLHR